MPPLLDLCEKYFGSRDLYEVLKIPNSATEKQGNAVSLNVFHNLFLPSATLCNVHLERIKLYSFL
jgi:hypothetical protein